MIMCFMVGKACLSFFPLCVCLFLSFFLSCYFHPEKRALAHFSHLLFEPRLSISKYPVLCDSGYYSMCMHASLASKRKEKEHEKWNCQQTTSAHHSKNARANVFCCCCCHLLRFSTSFLPFRFLSLVRVFVYLIHID